MLIYHHSNKVDPIYLVKYTSSHLKKYMHLKRISKTLIDVFIQAFHCIVYAYTVIGLKSN